MIPYLEVTKVLFVHYNVLNGYYEKNPRVLFVFVPKASLERLKGAL